MRQIGHALLLAGLVAGGGAAKANDSMSELGAGGLTFVKSYDVTMAREDLFISQEEVRVDYTFHNGSDKDVRSLVAFPMPDIEGGIDANIALNDTDDANFLQFSVTQDGNPIEATLQQRAYVAGIDMTEELQSRGVPLLPFADATFKALEGLPKETQDDWLARGLIVPDEYDNDGNGMKVHLTPSWTLKTTYWWNTTFPAGADVHVSHRYRPSVGGTVQVAYLHYDGTRSEEFRRYEDRYCIDETFEEIGRKSLADMNVGKPFYTEQWLSYILTTGANWNGPIGQFHLTIDKGQPENYVSFCGDGVKKTGPTTFEMTKQEFYPEKNLDVLFLVRSAQP
jgi:hypothetical protein